MKKLLFLTVILLLSSNIFAQEMPVAYHRVTVREMLIGSFVKTFAKTYVATHNLEQFKEKNIKKLMKMEEEKFQRVYRKIYHEMIKDLPNDLKVKYNITEDMTRQKAIQWIGLFKTKKEIYRMINAIPNKMIALHYKNHKKEFHQSMQKDGSGVDGVIDDLLTDQSVI